jgi:CheY-like chemotaxis protein
MTVVDAPLDGLHTILDAARQSGKPFDLAVIDCYATDNACLSRVGKLVDDPRLARLPVVLVVPKSRLTSDPTALPATAHKLRKPVHRSDIEALLAVIADGTHITASISTREEPRTRNGSILVVEDNVVNQTIALKMLSTLGYRADLAQDGRQALTMMSRTRYDLVFMDCQMPELDGFEATLELRNQERASGRHTVVVAMTANAMDGSREACLRAGMDDYMTKPVKLADLAEMTRRWIPDEPLQSERSLRVGTAGL